MSDLVEILSWLCLVVGVGFSITGAIGLLRLPEFFTRVHAVSVTDTMGVGLILLGCGLHSGLNLVTVKLVMIWLFVYLTGPAATHALAKAAYANGVKVEGERENRP